MCKHMGCNAALTLAMVVAAGCAERSQAAPPPPIVPIAQDLFCDGKVQTRGDASLPKDAVVQPVHARTNPGVGRAPADIQAVVRGYYGRFRKCYEAALARNPNATGTVIVRFVIDKQGNTTEACLKDSSLPDGQAISCMLDAYRELRFPPADGKTTVVYPITFSPG